MPDMVSCVPAKLLTPMMLTRRPARPRGFDGRISWENDFWWAFRWMRTPGNRLSHSSKRKRWNYAVVIGNEDLARLYAVDALPVTLLIDRDGKIADSHPGMVDKDAFENEIRALLQERAKNAAK